MGAVRESGVMETAQRTGDIASPVAIDGTARVSVNATPPRSRTGVRTASVSP